MLSQVKIESSLSQQAVCDIFVTEQRYSMNFISSPPPKAKTSQSPGMQLSNYSFPPQHPPT